MRKFPLELIDLICTKIKWKILSQICKLKNLEKTTLYRLNSARLKSYWKWVQLSFLVYRNDLHGVKYNIKYHYKVDYKAGSKNNVKLTMDRWLWGSVKTACESGRLEILQYFIEKGLQSFYKNGDNPCDYGLVVAKESNQLHIVKYLISIKVNSPELIDHCYNIIVQEDNWINLRGYAQLIEDKKK
jgi:hypothetical protein